MSAKLPRFAGEVLMTGSQWNFIAPIIEAALELRAGPGIGLREMPGGTVISARTSEAPASTSFYAKITGSALQAKSRYTYSWSEVRKVLAGYSNSAWEVVPENEDGLHGHYNGHDPAYNFAEVINNDSTSNHMLGNGVIVDANGYIPGTSMMIVPKPNGSIVEMKIVTLEGGSREYWFDYVNSMDGSCTPPG